MGQSAQGVSGRPGAQQKDEGSLRPRGEREDAGNIMRLAQRAKGLHGVHSVGIVAVDCRGTHFAGHACCTRLCI